MRKWYHVIKKKRRQNPKRGKQNKTEMNNILKKTSGKQRVIEKYMHTFIYRYTYSYSWSLI